MPKSLYPCTEAAEVQIITAIQAGAFPYIAAESIGIPREVFADWLRRGSGRHASTRYRRFRDKVRQAVAKARLKAEMYALKQDPLFWLKYGPGKETADIPGWSNAVKPPAADEIGSDAQETEIALGLLAALTPEMAKLTPETRAELIAALATE